MSLTPFLEREDSDSAIGKTSATNNEYYSSLIFKETTDEAGDIVEEVELIDVIIAISKKKNIVSTEVQNRPGDVNEYISDGDFSISVRGYITSDQRIVAPLEKAQRLEKQLKLPKSLEVACYFFEIFGIDTVVINDYDVEEIPGTRNSYQLRINMKSDTPIELIINSETQDTSNIA